MAAPVILVSAGFPAYADYMGIAYAQPLEAVGAVPLHLPFVDDVGRAMALADGVLLGFGSDIDPGQLPRASHARHRLRLGRRRAPVDDAPLGAP